MTTPNEPGAQFQVDVDAVLSELRGEVGSLAVQVAVLRSRLAAADATVAALRAQVTSTAIISNEAPATS